jgi:8-oxo-dGTP pyrophosphatase MutT (NUDIX family)
VEPGDGGAGPRLIRIDHDPLPDQPAEVLHRQAVRAVIRHGDVLLMMHSPVAGDFKFPGGGVEPGESAREALAREVSEECGRTVTHVGEVLLRAVEHRRAREVGHMFRMESTYFTCSVSDEVHDQSLDDYERDLVLTPVWVSIDEALATNRCVLGSGSGPTWVMRETQVLQALRALD